MKTNIPKGRDFQSISDLICALDGCVMKVEQDDDIMIIYACAKTNAEDCNGKVTQDISDNP